MLFNEIYSTYYNALATLINYAIHGELNSKNANELIQTEAFQESFVYIIDAIQKEQWQVITKDYKTPIKHYAAMPLTTLQMQFLKSISMDKRFSLFIDGPIEGLDNVTALYDDNDFYYFDIYNNGDPYEDPQYRAVFKLVLSSLKQKRKIYIRYVDGKGNQQCKICIPRKLEYSQKDDKFRLHCYGEYHLTTINLARIISCYLMEEYDATSMKPFVRNKRILLLEITDERGALERCMLHFSNYEKIATKLTDKIYEMELSYYKDDEMEVVIRVLSFGPLVKVKGPEHFIDLLKGRLAKQKELGFRK